MQLWIFNPFVRLSISSKPSAQKTAVPVKEAPEPIMAAKVFYVVSDESNKYTL